MSETERQRDRETETETDMGKERGKGFVTSENMDTISRQTNAMQLYTCQTYNYAHVHAPHATLFFFLRAYFDTIHNIQEHTIVVHYTYPDNIQSQP